MGTHPIFESDFDCLTESVGGEDGEFDYPASLVQGISDILEHGEGCYDHCTGMLPDEYYWKSYCMYHCIIKISAKANNEAKTTTAKTTIVTRTTTTASTTRSTTTRRVTTRRTTTTKRTTTIKTTSRKLTTKLTTTSTFVTAKMFEDGVECGNSPSLSMVSISEEHEDAVNFIVKNDTSDGDRLDNILVKVQPKMTSIVVNGKDVNTNERYPWLVALRTASGHHYCGGALISDSWILCRL